MGGLRRAFTGHFSLALLTADVYVTFSPLTGIMQWLVVVCSADWPVIFVKARVFVVALMLVKTFTGSRWLTSSCCPNLFSTVTFQKCELTLFVSTGRSLWVSVSGDQTTLSMSWQCKSPDLHDGLFLTFVHRRRQFSSHAAFRFRFRCNKWLIIIYDYYYQNVLNNWVKMKDIHVIFFKI